ncbi:MAG: hypothetical protein RBU37_12510 [Myxococcota bacterium]|jgi:hypothetical protein|nr:hypothetical protein [Myxococcota bacterium]
MVGELVLTVLLWLLAVLGVLLAVLLLLPFRLRADGGVHEGQFFGDARLQWAWGLVGLRYEQGALAVRVLGVRVGRVRVASSKRRKPSKKNKAKRMNLREWLKKGPNYLPWIRRLAKALKLELAIDAELGLDDPSHTALLQQLLQPLSLLGPWLRLRLRLDYLDEKIEIAANLRARVWIIQVSMLLMGMLVNTQARRLLTYFRAVTTPESPVRRIS